MPVGLAALPRAFNLSRWAYFLDFMLAPIAAAALIGLAVRRGMGLAPGTIFALFGFVAWTLAEYWIHRGVFHALPMFERMHTVHHINPKGWVGVSSWGTFGAFGTIWLVIAALIDIGVASAFTAGLIVGYLSYCIVHVRYHHGDRARFGRYIAFMWRHHAAHHRGGKGNFGVSSPVWDFVFGTYRLVSK